MKAIVTKRIRRDKLFRLAQAGKLIVVGSYHYEEMAGEEMRTGRFPVRISTKHGDFIAGVYNLIEFDFQSSSGAAWLSDDGMRAHLHVHGNCSYDFQMADGSPF